MTLPPLADLVGTHDLLLLTLDTLRFDAARDAMAAGETPHLAALLPEGWEERHAPASFTFASHKAFFAGFLPTPARPGRHDRLFAFAFPGSETTGDATLLLPGNHLAEGLAELGYRTVCTGGVGFFNPASPLGADLTAGFHEAYWEAAFGVTAIDGFERQIEHLGSLADDGRPCFTLVNVASLHQPNCHYLPGATQDSVASHRAALGYIDKHLPALLAVLAKDRPLVVIVCSDHGTAYGEDGYVGHRIGHEVVWTVPYGEALLPHGWRP
jgi:arylsulfatase A-like enzyme